MLDVSVVRCCLCPGWLVVLVVSFVYVFSLVVLVFLVSRVVLFVSLFSLCFPVVVFSFSVLVCSLSPSNFLWFSCILVCLVVLSVASVFFSCGFSPFPLSLFLPLYYYYYYFPYFYYFYYYYYYNYYGYYYHYHYLYHCFYCYHFIAYSASLCDLFPPCRLFCLFV